MVSRFDGSVGEGKALAYGHSYTANALGCAAAKASLEIFVRERVLDGLGSKIGQMHKGLKKLRTEPGVADIRQCGFIAGIEMAAQGQKSGAAVAKDVCVAARQHGLLTRPIRDVVVLMPPLCISGEQVSAALDALHQAISEQETPG